MADQKLDSKWTIEEIACLALNEQGFLFSQVIREKISGRYDSIAQPVPGQMVCEVPVTATDGEQTRIDIVLSRGNDHVCIECKRPNPKYKNWFFFDREPEGGNVRIENRQIIQLPAEKPGHSAHWVRAMGNALGLPIFRAYIEAVTHRPNRDQRVSHTETIEEAFRQVLRGQTGVMARIVPQHSVGFFRVIPVVVTTAPMYEVLFKTTDVTLSSGEVDLAKIRLAPLNYCAVNYAADDALSVKSQSVPKCNIETFVTTLQMRSVFVVQAEKINQFLHFLLCSNFLG